MYNLLNKSDQDAAKLRDSKSTRILTSLLFYTKKSLLTIFILTSGSHCADEKHIEDYGGQKRAIDSVDFDCKSPGAARVCEPKVDQTEKLSRDVDLEFRMVHSTIHFLEQVQKEPYNHYFCKEALDRYNWLRRSYGQDSIFVLDDVDQAWLSAVTYDTWKKKSQRTLLWPSAINKQKNVLLTLINDEQYFDQLKEKALSGNDDALYIYNYLRELCNMPMVSSLDQIDYAWVDEESYSHWKCEKREKLAWSDIMRQQSQLLSAFAYHTDMIEGGRNASFHKREVLYTYNYMRELCTMPLARSFNHIDHSWLFIKKIELAVNSWSERISEAAVPLVILSVVRCLYKKLVA